MTASPPLSGSLLLVALEGWTDAGDAASGALAFLREHRAYSRQLTIDSDPFIDYQFTRPVITRDADGSSDIRYPEIVVYRDNVAERTTALHLLTGPEPARRWRQLTDTLMASISDLGVTGVILLGALLADAPHTRPIAIHITSENAEVQRHYDIEPSSYEGPVGYLTVLAHAVEELGIPGVTIWASVPHYAHGTPSPKAASALIKKIEQLTGAEIPHGDLDQESQLWETTLNTLAAEDGDLGEYVRRLETARDSEDPPSASGDAIAAEIEKYLKRKDDRRGFGHPPLD